MRRQRKSASSDLMKNHAAEPQGTVGSEKLTDDKIKWTFYVAEAEVFMRKSEYDKADDYYTKALEFQPDNVQILHLRSKSRMLKGDPKGAEADADRILALVPASPTGHMCKADSLFVASDFEMAMVWYIRGSRVHQAEQDQLAEFLAGEAKCRDAIANAVKVFDASKLKVLIESKNIDSTVI
ncbi:Tetratricopeptide repeat protein 25, partial [Kappamyces sp. JEL0680]